MGRLHEAGASHLNHAEFLELILQDELVVRNDRSIDRRVKAAAFRDHKTLEDFDWQFNPSIKRKQIFDLASGDFIRKHRDVLLIGPPGVGKTAILDRFLQDAELIQIAGQSYRLRNGGRKENSKPAKPDPRDSSRLARQNLETVQT